MSSSTKRSSVTGGFATHRFSVASGVLACFSSTLGKVAFDGDTPIQVLAKATCEERFPGSALCVAVSLAVQGASLAGMFLVNAIMLSTFIKALQMSGSTAATVTNFATNLLLSGISGKVLFGESLPVLWFCGASLVVSGVVLLTGVTSTTHGDETFATGQESGADQIPPPNQSTHTPITNRGRPKRD